MAAFLKLGGRVLAACLVGLCMLIIFGEGRPKLTALSLSLDVALVGLVLGFFRPLPGGVLTLVGIACFYALNYHESGRWPGGWVFPLFWVAGVLLILGNIVRRGHA